MSYAAVVTAPGVKTFAEAVDAEVGRQIERWGDQQHPDGTGEPDMKANADVLRLACDAAFEDGTGTWMHILAEEVAEAFAESDPAKLRVELVQCAAVIASWLRDLDRRPAGSE